MVVPPDPQAGRLTPVVKIVPPLAYTGVPVGSVPGWALLLLLLGFGLIVIGRRRSLHRHGTVG